MQICLMKKDSKKQIMNEMVNMLIEKTAHNIIIHGMGFCNNCGELRKRCQCKTFDDSFTCNCYDTHNVTQ